MFFVGWAISRSHREQGGSIFLVLLVVKPAIFYLIAVVRYFKLVFSGKNIKNCCNKKGRLSILVFPWELPTYLHLPKDCRYCPAAFLRLPAAGCDWINQVQSNYTEDWNIGTSVEILQIVWGTLPQWPPANDIWGRQCVHLTNPPIITSFL